MHNQNSPDESGALAKALNAVQMAVASQVPPNMLADVLIRVGWPAGLINQAIEIWFRNNGRQTIKTDFKTWLKKYQKRARPAVAVVVVLGTIQAGIMLLKPWPMKIMADSAFGTIPAPGPLAPYTGTTDLIAITALMSIAIFFIGAVVGWISDYILLRIGFWLNRSIKADSFRHILHLPLYHQERLAKGDYVYRQNVVTNSLSDLVLGTTSSIISSIIMIIGVLIIMMLFNLPLTIVSVILMPFLYLTMKLIGPQLGKYSTKLTQLNSKTASAINEAVDNAETVQTFTLEDKQLFRVDEYWQEGFRLSYKSMMWGNLLKNSNSFLVILATSTVMYFGGSAAMHHQMTFGQLFIFMTYMGYLLGPVESLVQKITSRYQKIIDVGRVYEVLSDHEGIDDLRKNNPLPPNVRGVIDFEHVKYSYNGQTVFDDLNLHIAEGEKVAIIGPSGGGKSTVLKLLPLFIEPEAGRVMLGGYDTQNFSLRDLRQKVAWVSQSPQLFTGSILENIYDGDVYRQITMDEVKQAIETSNVLEFVVKMPLGVNSPVGENGSSLSGGQRQRVAIARALIKNAPILCLDEPTAALDAKSENYIRDSLMQIIKDKTVLMVTHRKSLLALMDTVYVLDNGTLRNVNELGGLDYYLRLLEGITEQQIAREVAEEKSYILPNSVDDYIGLKEAAQPVQTIITPSADREGDQPAPDGKTLIFTVKHTDDDYVGRSRRDSQEPIPNLDEERSSGDDEVVIKLH